MLPSIYEIKDIMKILHISRNTAYKLIRQEGFPCMRVAGHYKIPAQRFEEWLSEQIAHLQSEEEDVTMQM